MNRVVQLEDFMARPFIETWHYSRRATKGDHFYFGWLIDKKLYAVADYGIGVNQYQARSISSMSLLNVTSSNLIELKRLCRTCPKMDINLTQFMGRCHKLLKKMGYVYVVTFSDPAHGHTGGLYRAANFDYLGKTVPEYHYIDEAGESRHRLYPARYSKRNGCTLKEAISILKLTKVRNVAKDRWLLCINKKKKSYELC